MKEKNKEESIVKEKMNNTKETAKSKKSAAKRQVSSEGVTENESSKSKKAAAKADSAKIREPPAGREIPPRRYQTSSSRYTPFITSTWFSRVKVMTPASGQI